MMRFEWRSERKCQLSKNKQAHFEIVPAESANHDGVWANPYQVKSLLQQTQSTWANHIQLHLLIRLLYVIPVCMTTIIT